MLPERVDIVDRPATRRSLLLMKSEGATAELEKELNKLLKAAGSIESIDDIADRLETAGADKVLVGELRKVADDLAKATDAEDAADAGDDEKAEGEPPVRKKKRSMAKWVIDRLTNPTEKEEIVEDKKPDEAEKAKEGDLKKVETSTGPLTRDDLMKGLSEFANPFKEDLLKEINASVDKKIEDVVKPLTKRVEEIAEKKGLKKSIDGQETQEKEEPKKPLRKEFGKGMFDDVISGPRLSAMHDRLVTAGVGTGSSEEEDS
jgi:hypothetical protein